MLKAKNQEEQIAVAKKSDLYKQGDAKQSTSVKITISDAERDFAAARSQLLSLSQDAVETAKAGAEEVLSNHLDRILDLQGAAIRTKTRLYDLYALIMKDGE
jgi:hypothetical protein